MAVAPKPDMRQTEALTERIINWAKQRGVQYKREHRGVLPRQYRADIAFPEYKITAEIQGGLGMGGRGGHSSYYGLNKGIEKFNVFASEGWLVFQCNPKGRAYPRNERAIESGCDDMLEAIARRMDKMDAERADR